MQFTLQDGTTVDLDLNESQMQELGDLLTMATGIKQGVCPTGVMQMLALKEIAIDKSERMRERLPDGDPHMMQSLLREGPMRPIIVAKDYRILDGWRRVDAFRTLGWRMIPAEVLPIPPL